jgi:ubiquitin C-terminal hydrolase
MNELQIKRKKELNGLNNPGNFCYLISTIQSLRIILIEFFKYHSLLINYYLSFTKLINIFNITNDFKLELLNIKINKKTELLKLLNKVNINHNKNIIQNISEIEYIFNKLEKQQLKICCMLLLHQIIIELEHNVSTVKIINFIKMFNICTRNNGISYICNGEQNDSNEFLIILLDYLNDCVSCSKNCILDDKSILSYTSNELNKLDINNRVKIQILQFYYNTYSKEYSYFHENLNTLLLNVIKCVNCGFKQTSINSSNNICCSIPNKGKNLYDCLDNYFKEEIIEYKCDNCKKTDENIIIKQIIDNKKYIIITIKKFDYNSSLGILTKKHEYISYPLLLDINKYSLNNTNNYKLVSIINHIGMLNYGHYYSDVLFENKWFRCNDDKVNLIQLNKVTDNNNAYILIYKKID